ncbi:hypothetical protein FPV16_12050 [Methylobacterium sp. W2]|uniref:DUF5681 domain-containing protein n=1 Tax=Methylobacterium sp. W2 TaxID=2598107 RepID=UPI001D0C5B38|nr:DUF5681 domain-containing protein [Methylobacterium sp. W2]MCC0806953.1 hypothetical protein [Methylobacterium sp. W2]
MARTRLDTRGGTGRSHSQGALDRAEAFGGIDDLAMADQTSRRTTGGRFVKGVSGNSKGRPSKPKPAPDALLGKILDEEVQNNAPGQPARISIREALLRSLCVRGFKDPRIALSVLKLDALIRETSKGDPAVEIGALLAEEENTLEAYLAREIRRARRTQDGESAP